MPAAEDALRRRVAAVAGAVLGVPPAALLDGSPFDSFASFSSFRLIEIIERLESELGTEFDADDLVPANLRRVDDLCRIAR
ncbi:phosphopantetheine-binding protein [Streptomyces lydicus]|nr:phosphopantetheine-binding protein [Streptomyces lydicus]